MGGSGILGAAKGWDLNGGVPVFVSLKNSETKPELYGNATELFNRTRKPRHLRRT